MTSDTAGSTTRAKKRSARRRQIAHIPSLSLLVGAHPEGLRDIYQAGKPFDPCGVAEASPRLLAIDSLQPAFMLTRPLVRQLSQWLPWRSTRFESGGTAGEQQLLAGRRLRFSASAHASRVDGADTLTLRFAALDNPSWLAGLEQELRQVGDAVAMGPLYRAGGTQPIAWTGLSL